MLMTVILQIFFYCVCLCSQAKREADIQAAHDQAIFGSSAASPVDSSPVAMQKVHAEESITKESEEPGRNLMSEKVRPRNYGPL